MSASNGEFVIIIHKREHAKNSYTVQKNIKKWCSRSYQIQYWPACLCNWQTMKSCTLIKLKILKWVRDSSLYRHSLSLSLSLPSNKRKLFFFLDSHCTKPVTPASQSLSLLALQENYTYKVYPENFPLLFSPPCPSNHIRNSNKTH